MVGRQAIIVQDVGHGVLALLVVFVSAFAGLLVALAEGEEAAAPAVLGGSRWVLARALLRLEAGAFGPFVAERVLLASVALGVLGCLLRALGPVVVLVVAGVLVHWSSITW